MNLSLSETLLPTVAKPHLNGSLSHGGFELAGAGDGPTLQTEDAVSTVLPGCKGYSRKQPVV